MGEDMLEAKIISPVKNKKIKNLKKVAIQTNIPLTKGFILLK